MEVLELFKVITPELTEIIEKRFLILKSISHNQPIGRRTLAQELGFTERTIRDEVNILKDLGLINIDPRGMYIGEKGIDILEDLSIVYVQLKGLPQLEAQLKTILNIRDVIIVPGNSSENNMVLLDMGKLSFNTLKDSIEAHDIVGITGGNTMASVVKGVMPDKKSRDVIVIPARGGLGRDLNTQSNSIAAKLADALGGSYRLLYIPDSLGEEAFEYMLKNEEISQSINLINNISTLVFGIGRADTMAHRRNLPEEKIEELLKGGAVAEAFGHYFDLRGREIWDYKTIGLSLEKFKALVSLIGVAGGREKAEAIISVSSLNKNMVLVTDESAAKEIIQIVSKAI